MVHRPRSPFIFRRRGTVAIEYAIVLPVLLMFLLGIMDTGRLLWTYATLYRASEAAARCAAINAADCTTFSKTQSYAVKQAWGLIIDTSAFTVSNPICGMQVHASYTFDSYIFGLAAAWKAIPLTATACYPLAPPA